MATPGPNLSDFGPDSGGRLKGVTIVKPIVVGNVARWFGKKREEDGHTHSWTVYIRPYGPEDYSSFIKKVHFKLHDSYANPNRIVTRPPYEVQETGWGEFEVTIKIHFHDPIERPVTLYHVLKLFVSGGEGSQPVAMKKPLVSEFYDEITFLDPSLAMAAFLDAVRPATAYKHDTDFEEKKRQAKRQIGDARIRVKSAIGDLKEKLTLARNTITSIKEEMKTGEKGETPKRPPLPALLPVKAFQAAAKEASLAIKIEQNP